MKILMYKTFMMQRYHYGTSKVEVFGLLFFFWIVEWKMSILQFLLVVWILCREIFCLHSLGHKYRIFIRILSFKLFFLYLQMFVLSVTPKKSTLVDIRC